ncbi:kinase-like protein [Pleurotus eryngii]|uniref:Kinase-like protein n=1 Tax=Pleurotus eryngii TaxID=5323 RepID=A0A9P5ZQR1_PLEER|nr:kinase-like protein [Pleurotus eryngii]
MFAAATSFFARTAVSQSYNIGGPSTGSRSSTPGPSGVSSSTPAAFSPPITVGLWKVQSASHKVTNKRVSVWSFDKRGPEMERLSPSAKDRTLEVLKAEASALGRLRHPSILEMVEPLEETRSEIIFATEPILSSLDLSIPGSQRYSPLVELDEVEIQKGILQICKGLAFVHTSAQLIHSNICPESIVINNAGDWKLAGLGLTIALIGPGGAPARWEFPTFDGRVPPYIQRSFDYMAPEYALDEALLTASDMYSLGCLIYAVHCKGNPPFKNHGSLGGLRDNAGRSIPGMEGLDTDLQELLRSMITRHATSRPSPSTLPSHAFFSSLPISTLNFLDRSNFTAKTREEKISFMKGLTSVLDRFSEGLKSRKILPSLLEEMKDTHLLPYILPNVFAISNALTPSQFATTVLPSLKPLFVIKEPPQNMLTLLDNLSMLQGKTDKVVFREQVLPLVYNALESEHAVVQERALKAVPDLCESIDYAEVQGTLFPRVAYVFSKTRVLSVKVATLTTFLTMVKTLDQSSLTQKLVPLLSKIRTKEPAVMMATLSVQEAMGFKVDREAVATLVLPQLWSMSMGPLLNLDQFQRFMGVIKKLGERVEKEHNQFLRDSQRLEDRSSLNTNGNANGVQSFAGSVDFEHLVGGSNGIPAKSTNQTNGSWEDDVWGSIFSDDVSKVQTPVAVNSAPVSPRANMANSPSPPPSFVPTRASKLGAKPMSASSFNNGFSSPTQSRPSSSTTTTTPLQPRHTGTSSQTSWPSMQPIQPNNTGSLSSTIPTHAQVSTPPQRPNYNIAIPAAAPIPPTIPFSSGSPPQRPNYNLSLSSITPMTANAPPLGFSAPPTLTPMQATPPVMGGLLTPSRPAQTSISSRKPSNNDWGDFDPLA